MVATLAEISATLRNGAARLRNHTTPITVSAARPRPAPMRNASPVPRRTVTAAVAHATSDGIRRRRSRAALGFPSLRPVVFLADPRPHTERVVGTAVARAPNKTRAARATSRRECA